MDERDRIRALASLAYGGDPSPVETERRKADAWRLYTATGIPAEPGYRAVSDWYTGTTEATPALEVAKALRGRQGQGLAVLEGTVGSGRTYACCRVLWQLAARAATRSGAGTVGLWLDAGSVGMASYQEWGTRRMRLLAAGTLIVDDLGAAGSSSRHGTERLSELLEARSRARGLTIITTNIDQDAFVRLYGERLRDRVQGTSGWHHIPPSPSKREPGREAASVPAAVRNAAKLAAAAAAVDEASRVAVISDACTAALPVVEAWLRPPDMNDARWSVLLRDELDMAAQQRAQFRAAMQGLVDTLARCQEDSDAGEHKRLVSAHEARLATLREEQ